MQISKYSHTLSDGDYKNMYNIWFSAEKTKSGSRKVAVSVKDA